jgi:hypothetical protein
MHSAIVFLFQNGMGFTIGFGFWLLYILFRLVFWPAIKEICLYLHVKKLEEKIKVSKGYFQ